MSPSEIIGKGQKVYTPEEMTRRIEQLQNVCDVLAARLEALDQQELFVTAMPRGLKIVSVPSRK